MKKRIIIIKYGEKIYYVIQRRNFFFKWKFYASTEFCNTFTYNNEIYRKYNYILFTNRADAEYVMNWKDIKYHGRIIELSVSREYNNIIKYCIFDKTDNTMANDKLFDTLTEAKEYIISLPRQIGTINQLGTINQ